MPFFPRVLVHLVGFDHRVGERLAGAGPRGRLLEPVPEGQQVGPVALQLAGQLGRGHPLGDAAKDQDDLRGPAMGLVEGRPGEGIEDPAAARAAVVEHRGAMATVDGQALAGAAAWTGQAVGMEELDDPSVAGVFIHQLGDREVHGRLRGRRPR
jgi:hypothetical protein